MSFRDPLVGALAEEKQENIQTKRRITASYGDCPINLFQLTLLLVVLSVCLYCTLVCPDYLLLIILASACCCSRSPLLIVPLVLSIGLFIASHLRTIDQAFTISEDINTFNQKYK
jgi:hypothetical protein